LTGVEDLLEEIGLLQNEFYEDVSRDEFNKFKKFLEEETNGQEPDDKEYQRWKKVLLEELNTSVFA